MKTDLETFIELAKKLGYSVVKKKQPKFRKHTEISKNGHKWTEVSSNVWKDETSGLIWYDKIDDKFTWRQAMDLVKDDELQLPKASDFMVMVEHNGMEFLPNLKYNFKDVDEQKYTALFDSILKKLDKLEV